jgi:hypothetical protein
MLLIAATTTRLASGQSGGSYSSARVAVAPEPQTNQNDSSAQVRRAKENLDAAAQQQQSTNEDGPALRRRANAQAMRARMQKGAWLGLSASSPPPALRHQLKLPDGTGLVVDFVQPNSPAQKAGVRQYDLLVKLNDQLLINSPQLGVLVRTYKPNDELQLDLFREGPRKTIRVILVETNLRPITDEFAPQVFPDVRAVPPATPPSPNRIAPAPPDGTIIQKNERSLTWIDGKRQITVTVGDGNMLTISDAKTGKTMFKGTLDALEKQTQLPEEVRDAVNRVKEFLKAQPDKLDESVQKRNDRQAK